MSPCLFCPKVATLTGEHIWSEWMSDLLPGERHLFRRQFAGDPNVRTWESNSVNVKAHVVCETCNNGWMSDLESQHAKPAMQELILSDKPVNLTAERIRSIAIFA